VSTTTSSPPSPVLSPAPPAQRAGRPGWLTGGRLLGVLCVLVAVLGGAVLLTRAQHTVPVYVAGHDLASGTRLAVGDLQVVQVRLPGNQLAGYLRPATGPYTGRVLAAPVRKGLLIPTVQIVDTAAADLVETPIKVDEGDLAVGLHPGDQVEVLAAFTDGPRKGTAQVLLPAAEVVQVLRDTAGFGGDARVTGVQIRMPADHLADVAAAIANARILIVRAPTTAATTTTVPPAKR
jgi:hypothetical protein